LCDALAIGDAKTDFVEPRSRWIHKRSQQVAESKQPSKAKANVSSILVAGYESLLPRLQFWQSV